ncbi:MAG: hypothetical protein ACI4U2_03885 [Christensenellaceae bacterium]
MGIDSMKVDGLSIRERKRLGMLYALGEEGYYICGSKAYQLLRPIKDYITEDEIKETYESLERAYGDGDKEEAVSDDLLFVSYSRGEPTSHYTINNLREMMDELLVFVEGNQALTDAAGKSLKRLLEQLRGEQKKPRVRFIAYCNSVNYILYQYGISIKAMGVLINQALEMRGSKSKTPQAYTNISYGINRFGDLAEDIFFDCIYNLDVEQQLLRKNTRLSRGLLEKPLSEVENCFVRPKSGFVPTQDSQQDLDP